MLSIRNKLISKSLLDTEEFNRKIEDPEAWQKQLKLKKQNFQKDTSKLQWPAEVGSNKEFTENRHHI